MSDKDQNDIPKEQDAADEIDAGNLSQTEKAAFEKIMSQISETDEDGSAETAKSENQKPTKSENLEEPTINASEDPDDLSDDQQASLDKIMAEIGGNDDDQDTAAQDEGSTEAQKEETSTNNGQEETDSSSPDSSDVPADDETLSDDQQAALDKIMAEIGGNDDDQDTASKNDGSTEDKKEETPSENSQKETDISSPDSSDVPADDETLSDDQQAALDKIMAEIGGNDDDQDTASKNDGSTEDKKEETPSENSQEETESSSDDSSDAPADDETLSDDQQAALDKIMSEIGGNLESETPPPADDTESVSDTDSQETELGSPPLNAEGDSQQDNSSQGLSMEEFDDELSSLLSPPADISPTADESTKVTSSKQKPVKKESSLEDLNSALKSIVKETDTSETGNNQTDEDDTSQDQVRPQSSALEEIKDDPPSDKASKVTFLARLKKPLLGIGIACSAVLIAAATYWGYKHFYTTGDDKQEPIEIADKAAGNIQLEPEETQIDHQVQPEITAEAPLTTRPVSSADIDTSPKPGPFGALKEEIHAARQRLQSKKEEILELKRYYQNGIQEERHKLKLLSSQTPKPTSFKDALKNRQIELGLRSIQRRAGYNIKLDTPLGQIETYLEQLLYLERRIRLFELLDNSISGLSLAELKRHGGVFIQEINKGSGNLSVEKVTVQPPSLKSIWLGLSDNTSPSKATTSSAIHLTTADKQISKSICKGNFERKYLLTALSEKTAECLAKWPGKDLYLNELTSLSPKVAQQLAQWQGEWLSLNGIKTLSPEAAMHLSRWPGNRLSLNGVKRLSAETTAYLSQWQGEQLEMVGLTSIGRWENYVTHLFLSESLRRKLQVQ